jgi:hypothetical protein
MGSNSPQANGGGRWERRRGGAKRTCAKDSFNTALDGAFVQPFAPDFQRIALQEAWVKPGSEAMTTICGCHGKPSPR